MLRRQNMDSSYYNREQGTIRVNLHQKKAMVGLSTNNITDTVFWDARGFIHIYYVKNGKSITGEYYLELLDKFVRDLKPKRQHLLKKELLFH